MLLDKLAKSDTLIPVGPAKSKTKDMNRLIKYIANCSSRFDPEADTPIVFDCLPAVSFVGGNPMAFRRNNPNVQSGAGFWNCAEFVETLCDYHSAGFEVTALLKRFIKGMAVSRAYINGDWSEETGYADDEFNDDLMWFTMAMCRAYGILGEDFRPYSFQGKDLNCLETAQNVFNMVLFRSYDSRGGGGMTWKQPLEKNEKGVPEAVDHKNCCVNFPAIITACMLHKILPDYRFEGNPELGYKGVAVDLWNWCVANLIYDRSIYDKVVDFDPVVNSYTKVDSTFWSYNYGVAIGSLYYLNEIKDEGDTNDYLKLARELADTFLDYYKDKIPEDEFDGNDHPQFKAIAIRLLALLKDPKIDNTIRKWAVAARQNVNSLGQSWILWGQKTPEPIKSVFGHPQYNFGCEMVLCMSSLTLFAVEHIIDERTAIK